jgi:enediyne biosynthesis protein E4
MIPNLRRREQPRPSPARGRFATDVTDKAGVAGTESGTFHSGATFFDYDRDGWLDLYVGSYVALGDKRYCQLGNILSSCAPSEYRGSPDALYHNNHDGTFTNVTVAAKIYQPEGKNLSVAAVDYDDDGWPDLFVANDGLNAYLCHNERNGTFKETGLASGMAVTAQGRVMAAMCISLGDYDNDGRLDLYISDFQRSSDHLWHNEGKGWFDEVSDQADITRLTRDVLSFGGGFFDYDNDGWLYLSPTAMSIPRWSSPLRALITSKSIPCSTTKETAGSLKSARCRVMGLQFLM